MQTHQFFGLGIHITVIATLGGMALVSTLFLKHFRIASVLFAIGVLLFLPVKMFGEVIHSGEDLAATVGGALSGMLFLGIVAIACFFRLYPATSKMK